MRSIIIGTAGHIDHGKTALVKALTGMDTDRLPEEKARGITIDLGFAHAALGGIQVSFIDVPGHERFVRNMLAGIGGVDLLMLVVAADESVMPQTREHFEICRLLGIQSGFVAITKIDLVDSDTLQSVRQDIAELVSGSFLEGAPVVGVSSRTGEGMDDLRKLLEGLAAEIPPRSSDGLLRLPVDRVFTLKGRGTVVTGTLMTGKLSRESTIEILPQHRKARVRSVHAHDAPVELAVAGQRTALNLQGVEKEEVHRGDVLTQLGIFENTNLIDARITLLSNSMPLRNNAIVRLHHLASDTPARITFPGRDSLHAGESAIAQVRLQRPLFALYGDRFILRKHSPLTTIGGGLILDHQPARRIRKKDVDAIPGMERLEGASPEERLLLAVQERGLQGANQKILQAKLARSADQLGNLKVDGVVWLKKNPLLAISSSSLQTLLDRTVESVSEYHKIHPLFPGMPKQEILAGFPIPKEIVSEVLDVAGKKGLIALRKDSISLPGWTPAASETEQVLSASAEASLIQHRLEFPQLDAWARELAVSQEQARKILYWLVRENRAIKIDDDYFIHSTVWTDLKQRIKALKDARKTFGVADFKTLFGVSRKYAIPLLERLDREGVTRRAGNERIIL